MKAASIGVIRIYEALPALTPAELHETFSDITNDKYQVESAGFRGREETQQIHLNNQESVIYEDSIDSALAILAAEYAKVVGRE